MARQTVIERIQQAAAACQPRSRTGRLLLARYLGDVDYRRETSAAEQEVWNVYELCRLVEQHTFEPLSPEALQAAITAGPSPTARNRRRLVLSRLRPLLEEDGFPTRAEVRASNQIQQILQQLPEKARENLARWLAHRKETNNVGWHELAWWEASRIAELELLAEAADPGESDAELLKRWLSKIVRRVVDCRCPLVTRVARGRDPLRCMSCGATPATHGTTNSPGPKRRRGLEATGGRYLAFRRNNQQTQTRSTP